MPPAAYRRRGSHTRFDAATAAAGNSYDVRIETLPPLTAVHIGPHMEVNRAPDRLFGWLATSNQLGAGLRSFAIFYGDVDLVPPTELRSRASAVADPPLAAAPPFERATISGGEYAVLRHNGHMPI